MLLLCINKSSMARSSAELLEQSEAQWFLLSTCGAGSEGKHAAAWGLDGTSVPVILYSATMVPQYLYTAALVPLHLYSVTMVSQYLYSAALVPQYLPFFTLLMWYLHCLNMLPVGSTSYGIWAYLALHTAIANSATSVPLCLIQCLPIGS